MKPPKSPPGIHSIMRFVVLSLVVTAVISIISAKHSLQDKATADRVFLQGRALSIAFWQYATDHDGHFPHADAWEDALNPYLTEDHETRIRVPSEPGKPPRRFAMNQALSGVDTTKVSGEHSRTAILFFVMESGARNAHGTPPDRLPEPPANVVGYADGFTDIVTGPLH